MATALLDMLRDSITFWRNLIFVFMAISFLKFTIRLYFDYRLQKLINKDRFRLEIDGDRKCVEIISHEKIHLDKLQSSMTDQKVLLESSEEDKNKKAS